MPTSISNRFNMNAFESWKDACEVALTDYPWIDARSVSPLGFTANGQIQSGVVFDVKRDVELKDLAERIVQEIAPPIFNLHVSWMDSSHRAVEINIKLTLVEMGGVVRYGCVSSMDDYPDEAIKESMGTSEYKITNYCNRSYTAFTFAATRQEYPNTIYIDDFIFYRLNGI